MAKGNKTYYQMLDAMIKVTPKEMRKNFIFYVSEKAHLLLKEIESFRGHKVVRVNYLQGDKVYFGNNIFSNGEEKERR